MERTAKVAVEEELKVLPETYANQFEKELKRIMKESNYSNAGMIYKKFYKESLTPSAINKLMN